MACAASRKPPAPRHHRRPRTAGDEYTVLGEHPLSTSAKAVGNGGLFGTTAGRGPPRRRAGSWIAGGGWPRCAGLGGPQEPWPTTRSVAAASKASGGGCSKGVTSFEYESVRLWGVIALSLRGSSEMESAAKEFDDDALL